jgi:hypothetical protein
MTLGHLMFNVPAADSDLARPSPGLPAAVALLMGFAFGFTWAALSVLAASGSCPRSFEDRRTRRAIWLLAIGIWGCLPSAVCTAGVAPDVAPLAWVVSLGSLALSVHALQAPSSGGPAVISVLIREARATLSGRAPQPLRPVDHAPNRGCYRGQHPALYWATVALILLVPPAFVSGPRLMALAGMPAPPKTNLHMTLFALGAGLLFALLYWLRRARLVRAVTWDKDGFEVTGYRGDPHWHDWTQVIGVRVSDRGTTESTRVFLRDGASFAVSSRYTQYEELLAALSKHSQHREENRE